MRRRVLVQTPVSASSGLEGGGLDRDGDFRSGGHDTLEGRRRGDKVLVLGRCRATELGLTRSMALGLDLGYP